MQKTFVALLLASLFVFGVAGAAIAANTPNLGVTAALVTKAPVIDGILSDEAWVTASQMGAKVVLDLTDPGTAIIPFPRIAYVTYDAENLYIAYVILTPDVEQLVTTGMSITANDEVEVNLLPAGAPTYSKITVDAGGAYLSRDFIGGDPKFAIAKEGSLWTVEIAIPFASVGVFPVAGDQWRIGLYGRQMAAGSYWITWNPTYGSFNNIDRYGVLTFGQ